MRPTILFCNSFTEPTQPNDAFAEEYSAARQAGFETLLFNDDLFIAGDIRASMLSIHSASAPREVIYRGWMLEAKSYQNLFSELYRRNLHLINPPDEYLNAHFLPCAYPYILPYTPRTIWFDIGTPMVQIQQRLEEEFGSHSILVKDFVKSQKHYWLDACFIPSAADSSVVERVTRKFLELQGDCLIGGLVYREYVELEKLAVDPASGLPLSTEVRIFIYNTTVLSIQPYWQGYSIEFQRAEIEPILTAIASTFPSHFFTIDLARKTDGSWLVVEVGDGQVSGIQDGDYTGFYKAMLGATEE